MLAYGLFLAAVVLLGAYPPTDSFPYAVALSQGPLLVILVLGCAFIFAVDSVSREHEKGTAQLLFGTPASRGALLGAKALVPLLVWFVTVAALAAAYLTLGLGTQFALLWLVALCCATLLFLSTLGLLLLISAAVKGRGAPFVGVMAILFIFFSSGYFPVELAGGLRWLSPAYHEYLLAEDLLDGALGSPLPLALLILEAAAFFGLALWAFKRSEVSS